jgi:Uma2 family endonuclease
MFVMPVNNLLTREDLDALPDDGLRHELIDGAFVMTPSPGVGHQDMSAALIEILRAAVRGTDLKALYAPLDVALGTNVVQPDLLIARADDFTDKGLPVAPLLVVEIRSPSTAWLDEGRKRTIYEEAGVGSYWLLDPATPSIRVLELVDGHYIEATHATGDQTISVTNPVHITLNPAALARG